MVISSFGYVVEHASAEHNASSFEERDEVVEVDWDVDADSLEGGSAVEPRWEFIFIQSAELEKSCRLSPQAMS